MENKKPEGFESFLGPYKIVAYDSYSGEPVSWGFKVIKHLGDKLSSELREKYELEYIDYEYFLISKKLTREDAIKLYGPITHEEFGPKGGWKYIEFGGMKFSYKNLKNK